MMEEQHILHENDMHWCLPSSCLHITNANPRGKGWGLKAFLLSLQGPLAAGSCGHPS